MISFCMYNVKVASAHKKIGIVYIHDLCIFFSYDECFMQILLAISFYSYTRQERKSIFAIFLFVH